MSGTGFILNTVTEHVTAMIPRAAKLGNSDLFDPSSLVSLEQANAIELIAIAFASLSATAAACGIYWFLVMRRNFRRDLILLLIVGDLWKSLWFGINAAVTFALGRPDEDSKFCLASGYMLFTGIESCDWAIFFQALHMYLQVFPPRNNELFGYDGLYRVRKWVLAAWLFLPNLSASLAFVNNSYAYVSQGGFCTLPIRPFWYRLALSWIPRYLIWAFTLAVAVRIYSHVGLEFQVFGAVKDDSTSNNTIASTTAGTSRRPSRAPRPYSASMADTNVEKQLEESDEGLPIDDDGISPLDQKSYFQTESGKSSLRGPSAPNSARSAQQSVFGVLDHVPFFNRSTPGSRRDSRQASSGTILEDAKIPTAIELDERASWMSRHSSKSSGPMVTSDPAALLTPIQEIKSKPLLAAPVSLVTPENAANRAIQQRRQAVQRQLRLLFIYPVVYMLLWIMPFIYHAMSYSDYYAQHPIFAIRILNIFCQCFMGFADVSIFCWREKPWRHIPGSNGTFIGSFAFWRFAFGAQWHESRYQSRTLASHADNEAALEAPVRFGDYFSRFNASSGGVQSGGSANDSSSVVNAPRAPPPPPIRLDAIGRQHSSHAPHYSVGLRSPLKRGFSGISDRRAMEVDQAHARLQLERDDWEKRRLARREQEAQQRSRQASEDPSSAAIAPAAPQAREWWDKELLSIDDD